MPEHIDVSIVMPCLDEAETIAACVAEARAALEQAGISGEVIVADNGSTDGSRDLATRAGARVVAVSERGYGAAIRGGCEAAAGTFLVIGDADSSYDFGEAPRLVERLRTGADLVMGNRFRGGIEAGAMPWLHRWVGNPVLSFIGRRLFGGTIGDFHCGLRGLRRTAWSRLDLRTTGMEFASEMVIKSTLLGMTIEEVPVRLRRDGRSRPPHLRTWRDGWRHLRFMLLFSPLWLFAVPGVLLLAPGLLATCWLLSGPMQVGRIGLDIHTLLVASSLSLVGHQLLVFGAFTKQFAISEGFHPPTPAWSRFTRLPALEIGVVFGALCVVGGLAWLGSAVAGWEARGFGTLDPRTTMREVIPGVLLLMLGVQTVFASFFLGVLGLRRRA